MVFSLLHQKARCYGGGSGIVISACMVHCLPQSETFGSLLSHLVAQLATHKQEACETACLSQDVSMNAWRDVANRHDC